MNNSSDFMMYLHEDKVQRMKQDHWIEQDGTHYRPTNRGIQSPFARVRGAISTLMSGSNNRDLNQS